MEYKTKLQIIARLWRHVYDLLGLIKGYKQKSLGEIEKEIEITANFCEIYENCDDDELYLIDITKTARNLINETKGAKKWKL